MADYLVTDTELTDVADAIREKGGTSAALEWPDEYVSAIAAIPTGGGGATKTVQVTLQNPSHASEAKDPACILYEADTLSGSRTKVGEISSPTGNATITMTKNLLIAEFHSYGYLMTGSASGLYGVYGFVEPIDSGNAFYVDGDGYATINYVDYDD